MKDKIIQNLYNNYLQKTLYPFYIINGNAASNIIQNFLKKILTQDNTIKKKDSHLLNQDIFILDKEPDKKEYTVLGPKIIELNKYFSYCPIELKYKIIIFKNADKLSNAILNKLLLTLEEPPKDFVIFFENPRQLQFLPTIESRAIKIILSNDDNKESELQEKELDFLSKYMAQSKNTQEFIIRYKDKKSIHYKILKYFIRKSSLNDAKSNNLALEIIKQFNIAQKFNRGTLEILASYSQYIIEYDKLS